jgi:hypothetical protein
VSRTAPGVVERTHGSSRRALFLLMGPSPSKKGRRPCHVSPYRFHVKHSRSSWCVTPASLTWSSTLGLLGIEWGLVAWPGPGSNTEPGLIFQLPGSIRECEDPTFAFGQKGSPANCMLHGAI